VSAVISVVIASHGRPDGIRRLVGDLADQQLSVPFEVIIVDDASVIPVAESLREARQPAEVRVLRIPHAGPGGARDVGTKQATGDIIVFVDDDMRLPPTFLSAHHAEHVAARPRGTSPLVVFGTIASADMIADMPLFERYHARQLERFQAAVRAGRTQPRGVHLCTGNVSLPAEAYRRCGGFDLTLKRSEDRDLGVRLQRIGASFRLSESAVSVHRSDHTRLDVWLRRAAMYGRSDMQISLRHPELFEANPWRFWAMMPAYARPLLLAVLVWPTLGPLVARLAFAVAWCLDAIGMEAAAIGTTALSFAAEYFRGLRLECGSLQAVRRLAQRSASATAMVAEPAAPSTRGAVGMRSPVELAGAIRADHDATRRQRLKYHGEQIGRHRLLVDVVTKVGLQMLAWTRLMTWLHARRVPLLPALCSRLIRHLYGAEIHWRARIAPGVSVVHGTGLVISHGAEVGAGCILFHGVTLGESIDPTTGDIGSPRLGRDVHVGPGATILGPIEIGDGSKIMAGCVVTTSVPANSLVASPSPVVTARTALGRREATAQRGALQPDRLPLATGRAVVH
jgi:serine acetyltransferase/glycosyltransferase involved in cell wall biosynthesis